MRVLADFLFSYRSFEQESAEVTEKTGRTDWFDPPLSPSFPPFPYVSSVLSVLLTDGVAAECCGHHAPREEMHHAERDDYHEEMRHHPKGTRREDYTGLLTVRVLFFRQHFNMRKRR